jgi:cardiolipin synthase C
VGLVHAGYMRYREDLLRGGVELYEFKPDPRRSSDDKHWIGSSGASLHAKTLGADGKRLFVGSFNLDPRSVAINTEMGIIIENEELAGELARAFERVVARQAYRVELVGSGSDQLRWSEHHDGAVQTYDSEPHTSWWQRFATRMLSVVVPESML